MSLRHSWGSEEEGGGFVGDGKEISAPPHSVARSPKYSAADKRADNRQNVGGI